MDVEDTAFVVRRAVYQDQTQTQNARYILSLSDDTKEELLPDTLFIGQGNVLYCRVKNLAFPARFTRASYYQLARYVEEDNNTYYLPYGEKRQRIL